MSDETKAVPENMQPMAEFTEWFLWNYPEGCVLAVPVWHAPKIFRAAERSLRAERDAAEEMVRFLEHTAQTGDEVGIRLARAYREARAGK